MKDTAVILGTPAVGAVVIGAASAIAFMPAELSAQAFGAGMMAGWALGHVVLYKMQNPPETRMLRRFELDALRKPKQPTTFILPPQSDGFTPRVSSAIPVETWQAVAGIVVQLQCKNLTQNVLALALRDLSDKEIRQLHMQMIALLIPAGVINQKGNGHNEITEPEGRWFFLRMDSIQSEKVLDAYSLPIPPRLSPSAQSGDYSHPPRAPRANLGVG